MNWCAWFLRMRRPGEAKVHLACSHGSGGSSGIEHDCGGDSLSSLELSVSQGSLRRHPQASAATAAGTAANGNLLYVGLQAVDGLHQLVCPPLLERRDGRLGGVGGPGLEAELTQILEEVRYIARRFRGQDAEETACSEWKFAAAVVDRLCLVAFSLFTILTTIGILMSAPNFVDAISKDFFS